jgi:hypothetical protein
MIACFMIDAVYCHPTGITALGEALAEPQEPTASPGVERTFHVKKKSRCKQTIQRGVQPTGLSPGRLPRITRLMALAIHFDELLITGEVSSQAALARLGNVTRARLTQVMNLLFLAPDLQQQILEMPLVKTGRAPPTERELRGVAQTPNWREQRRLWGRNSG